MNKFTFFDKFKIVLSIYRVIPFFPKGKRVALILKPVDAVRYLEFSYLLKFLAKKKLENLDILDISSPHSMSYLLSRKNNVIKTNIDPSEEKFIKKTEKLTFKLQDATELTYNDDKFDLVYSISVVEHIYEKYVTAIKEMFRVTKPGGFVYLSFPVSNKHVEEWSQDYVYSNQYKDNEKRNFFQYRFSKEDCDAIINEISKHAIILNKDIYWEASEGKYNTAMAKMQNIKRYKYINFIKSALLNMYFGFTLFEKKSSSEFTSPKDFGNMQIILRKK